MFDGMIRKRLDPLLDRLAGRLAARGVGADAVTLTGFALGIAGAVSIAAGAMLAGLALILVSRLADGLDGAVARQTRPTDLGGYLDIVLDFVFYGAVPLAFALADPAANAVPAAVLLFAFYANGASFLAFGLMAEKRGLVTTARGVKSIYFTTGLAEATETIAAFALACLFPGAFPVIAFVFAAMTAWTCLFRVRLAIHTFG